MSRAHRDDGLWLRRSHSVGHLCQLLNLRTDALGIHGLARHLHLHRQRHAPHSPRRRARQCHAAQVLVIEVGVRWPLHGFGPKKTKVRSFAKQRQVTADQILQRLAGYCTTINQNSGAST